MAVKALATKLLPEERFHVAFGRAACGELATAPANRSALTQAVHDLVHFTLPFFGRSVSPNNELFRRWGIKHRTNDGSRAEFVTRCRRFVVDDLGLGFPAASTTWRG